MDLDDLVGYERRGRTAYLLLNRPDKLNAISDDVVEVFKRRLEQFDADEEAWVAILHGEGRAFSSGADVVQRQLRPREELKRFGGPQPKRNHAAHVFYEAVNWKPIIAACHGYAYGAALGWALSSDLIVASSDTKFQITEVSRGLAGARLWRLLAAKVGHSFADDVALTGRAFSAEEAHSHGLLTAMCDPGEHLETAERYADMILSNPPLAVRLMVRARRLEMEELDRRWTIFAQPFRLHLTRDFHESARAFVEKRHPTYMGE